MLLAPAKRREMSPLDAFVAQANITRLRKLIAKVPNADLEVELQRQLQDELEKLRLGNVGESSPP